MNTLLTASPLDHKGHVNVPMILAYGAGIVFTLASAAVNVRYALGKTDDPTMQAVWAGVAVGASVALALAPSAFVASLQAKRYGGAILSLVALMVFGAYSVTAALGSATGGRLVASVEADDVTAKRKAAARDIEVYTREIATIGEVRSVPEVEAAIRSVFAATPGLDDCTPRPNRYPTDRQRKACQTIATLHVEKAGAGRKAALTDDIRDGCRKYETPQGVRIPATMIVSSARKP